MSNLASVALTCEETPLKWPSDVSASDIKIATDAGILVKSPWAGSLHIVSRRNGAGDGVNIEENAGLTVDYRGQIYNYDEAVFHTPGLHVFPGETTPYSGEYHIHLSTIAKPQRTITIIVPIKTATGDVKGHEYFIACRRTPDPGAKPPLITTLLKPGADTFQYQGPDIRGRTRDMPSPGSTCSSLAEHIFILVIAPVYIRATDLERIPREGSASSDPRDLPAPGIKPKANIPRARLLANVVIAKPGVIDTRPTPAVAAAPACKQDNQEDRVANPGSPEDSQGSPDSQGSQYLFSILFAIGLYLGIYIADSFIVFFLWQSLFVSDRVKSAEPLKAYLIFFACFAAIFSYDSFISFVRTFT